MQLRRLNILIGLMRLGDAARAKNDCLQALALELPGLGGISDRMITEGVWQMIFS